MQHEPIAVFPPFEELAEAMNLNLREGEATRLIGRALEIWGRPKPFHVSDRMPEKAEMTDDGEVWIEDPGGEYPVGGNDFDWEPHKWILGPITKYAIHKNRRWLAADALPLPEVK